jgi:hypothetical protein
MITGHAAKVDKVFWKVKEEIEAQFTADLPTSDLLTNSDVAKYFYYVSARSGKEYQTQIKLVQLRIKAVWKS